MPNSPEAEHLQRAVDAVKLALLPQKKKEPIVEKEDDYSERESEPTDEKE